MTRFPFRLFASLTLGSTLACGNNPTTNSSAPAGSGSALPTVVSLTGSDYDTSFSVDRPSSEVSSNTLFDSGVEATNPPSSDPTSNIAASTDDSAPPSSSSTANPSNVADSGTTDPALTDSQSSSDGPDPSAEIYDPTLLPRFDIELAQAEIDALNSVMGAEDPQQDTYISANFRYGDETVANVGLRIKGEGSFQTLDRKPALKLKFDEFVSDQTFHGLKRLALNNLFEDPSFIAERLAYDVYRAAGLPAPRCNSALVYINNVYYGVYANVEAEDKTFLRRWFQAANGNLYEEGQTDFVFGAETAFNLETNETENDRTDLINLIAAVEGATSPDTFLDDIGAYLDTNNYLKFTAVEAAVNQWDMYSYTVFWVNNLRLYNDPATGKFHFIPWGHDMSMKPYRDSGKPYVQLFELARRYDQPSGSVTSGVLLQRCLESAPCVAAYRQAVQEVITIYDDLDLETRAATYYQQIKDAVYEDSRKNLCCEPDPVLTNDAFDTGYQSVLTTIRGRTAALRSDLERQLGN